MTTEAALYRKIIVYAAIIVTAIGVLGAGIAGMIDSGGAAAAAAAGGGAALVVSLIGPAAMLASHHRAPWLLALAVVSEFLVVILIAIALVSQGQKLDGSARVALVVTFGCGVLAGLTIKLILTTRARVPYVAPGSS